MAGRRDRQVPSVGERRAQGDRLSALRKDTSLSQSQLGARVGWTAHDVSNLEAGVRSVATLRLGTAVRFADALGMDIGEFSRRVLDVKPWPTDSVRALRSLRERRVDLGLSLVEVARSVGVSPSAVHGWEVRSGLSGAELRRVVALARVLRVGLGVLVGC